MCYIFYQIDFESDQLDLESTFDNNHGGRRGKVSHTILYSCNFFCFTHFLQINYLKVCTISLIKMFYVESNFLHLLTDFYLFINAKFKCDTFSVDFRNS